MWIDNVELQPSHYVLWFMLCFLAMRSICMLCFGIFSMSLWLSGGVLSHGGTPNHPVVMDDSGWPWRIVLKQPWWLLGNPPTTSETPHFRWESQKLGRADPGIAQPRSRSASPVEHLQFTALSRLSQGEARWFQGWSPVDTMGSPGLKEIKMWIKGETLGHLV